YVSRILNFSTATTFTITTSYTDSPLTLTITPTSAANRLRIEASLNLYLLTLLVSTAIPSTDVHVDALLVRNGITVREWRYVANFQTGVGVTSSPQPVNVGPYGNIAGNYYLSLIYSPAGTLSLSYT